MSYGAVIIAAGSAALLGARSPTQPVGDKSMLRQLIARLRQADIEDIAVVTDAYAEELASHLTRSGVSVLHCGAEASAGIRGLCARCDKLIVAPAGVPLFDSYTVRQLLKSGSDCAVPVYEGRRGSPVLLSGAYSLSLAALMEGGMEAIVLPPDDAEVLELPVEDEGTVLSAESDEAFRLLSEYYEKNRVYPVLEVSLYREAPVIDGRIAELLSLVAELGSVRHCAKRMGISYSSTWNLIRSFESQVDAPLISRSQGGAKGGRSTLTPEGKRILEAYTAYSGALTAKANDLFGKYFDGYF